VSEDGTEVVVEVEVVVIISVSPPRSIDLLWPSNNEVSLLSTNDAVIVTSAIDADTLSTNEE